MARTGIDTFIFKTASICNLNCTYCYYFNGADNSWRSRQSLMSAATIRVAVDRIISHARQHRLAGVDLVLHGGEPLIMGKQRFAAMMRQFDRIDDAGIATRRKGQSNGVLLDDEWIHLLAAEEFHLGISLDGPKEINDRLRVDHSGRGSYGRAVHGLELALAKDGQGLHTSVLAVIDPTQSGAAMYHHLRALGVDRMDFLLPESNYAHPPDGYAPLGMATPYADYLISVAEAWLAEDNPRVTVRLLSRILEHFLGGDGHSDMLGTAPVRVAVIETDGAIEPTDNYKACRDGMTDLGLDVRHHGFEDLYRHPFFRHCIEAGSLIPAACAGCRHLDLCGGGRMTHRFSEEEGFGRRSIYCRDLMKLYDHLARYVAVSKRQSTVRIGAPDAA